MRVPSYLEPLLSWWYPVLLVLVAAFSEALLMRSFLVASCLEWRRERLRWRAEPGEWTPMVVVW